MILKLFQKIDVKCEKIAVMAGCRVFCTLTRWTFPILELISYVSCTDSTVGATTLNVGCYLLFHRRIRIYAGMMKCVLLFVHLIYQGAKYWNYPGSTIFNRWFFRVLDITNSSRNVNVTHLCRGAWISHIFIHTYVKRFVCVCAVTSGSLLRMHIRINSEHLWTVKLIRLTYIRSMLSLVITIVFSPLNWINGWFVCVFHH